VVKVRLDILVCLIYKMQVNLYRGGITYMAGRTELRKTHVGAPANTSRDRRVTRSKTGGTKRDGRCAGHVYVRHDLYNRLFVSTVSPSP
jgi:hypothetical protein